MAAIVGLPGLKLVANTNGDSSIHFGGRNPTTSLQTEAGWFVSDTRAAAAGLFLTIVSLASWTAAGYYKHKINTNKKEPSRSRNYAIEYGKWSAVGTVSAGLALGTVVALYSK